MSTDARKNPLPPDYVSALDKRGFKLEERIGHGAYGSVYRATQEKLGRRVAVKFFDRPYMDDPVNRKRFDQEGHLLARVEHASIPYVITKGEIIIKSRQIPFIIMQLVRGEPLDKILQKKKRLETRHAAQVAKDILSPLIYAHQNKVIHRDVKPDNIIIGNDITYLIDFSIGICLEYKPGLTRASNRGQGVGTAEYSSPEQLSDSSSVDHRTDIFSVGIILFEMLAGHCKIDLEKLDSQLSGVPEELKAIIRKACARDRDNRFGDALAFRKSLDEFCNSGDWITREPTTAICPTPGCPGSAWSSRDFLRGPRVIDSTVSNCCENCGAKLIKSCPKCRGPLPSNIRELVVKSGKGGPDNIRAYCGGCGALIHETPTCKTCGSLLQVSDLNKDTKAFGCSKRCKRRQTTSIPPQPESDSHDDIPF